MICSIGFGRFSRAPLPLTSSSVATTACQPLPTRSVCLKFVVYDPTLWSKVSHNSKTLRLPTTHLSLQAIAQMDWCVITVACALLERPSAVAAPQPVRADQSVHPHMVCEWLHKLQDVMHAITSCNFAIWCCFWCSPEKKLLCCLQTTAFCKQQW